MEHSYCNVIRNQCDSSSCYDKAKVVVVGIVTNIRVGVYFEQAEKVQREKRAIQVLLVWTCRGLRERREPLGSQESQVLKDCQGHQVYREGMD